MIKYADLTNNKIKLSARIPLSTPFGLFIDPTNICNFRCSFCTRNQDDFSKYAGNYRHMSLHLFKKLIDDLKDFSEKLKVLRLYYLGEPLLCPDFLSMLEYAMRGGWQNVLK